jgi:hypothetical protein
MARTPPLVRVLCSKGRIHAVLLRKGVVDRHVTLQSRLTEQL